MSSSAALGDTGRMGIDGSLLGQREVRTYGKLGEEKETAAIIALRL